MAGQAKRMIEQIISERAKGNRVLMGTTRTKLLLKGISVGDLTDSSPDDPEMLARIRLAASELGIAI